MSRSGFDFDGGLMVGGVPVFDEAKFAKSCGMICKVDGVSYLTALNLEQTLIATTEAAVAEALASERDQVAVGGVLQRPEEVGFWE